MEKNLKFKVHTARLLQEICDGAMPTTMGVLKVPMNVFRLLLLQVGERAAQLNDPILNALMCDLAIYGVADPDDPDYNQEILLQVYKMAKEQKEKEAKQ